MKKSSLNKSFIFDLLPFVIVILASTISFKLNSAASHTGGGVAFVNDPRRLIVLGAAYSMAVIVLLKNLQYLVEVIKRQWVYFILLSYVLLSMMWSVNPVKVVIDFGHFMGVFLSVLAAMVCFRKDRELMFLLLSLVFSFTLLLSIFVSLTNPAIGIHHVTGRWQGVAGNPNTLGAICIISMWVNTVLYLLTKSTKKKVFVFVGVGLSVIALFGARSMTSVLVTFMMVSGVYLLAVIEYRPKSFKVFVFMAGFIAMLIMFLVMYIAFPEKLTVDSALGAIGKDSTFTGRTNIWEVALFLIKNRMVVGYSFDSLLSAFDFLGYQITQFHNGYLDFMVRGGSVGMLLFLPLLIDVYKKIKVVVGLDYKYAVASMGLVLAILIHNLTEASIMRSTHMLWTMFVFIMCSLASIQVSGGMNERLKKENRKDVEIKGDKYGGVRLR